MGRISFSGSFPYYLSICKLGMLPNQLRQRMVQATEALWQVAQHQGISLRTAGYVLALERIGAAIAAKGTRDYYTRS